MTTLVEAPPAARPAKASLAGAAVVCCGIGVAVALGIAAARARTRIRPRYRPSSPPARGTRHGSALCRGARALRPRHGRRFPHSSLLGAVVADRGDRSGTPARRAAPALEGRLPLLGRGTRITVHHANPYRSRRTTSPGPCAALRLRGVADADRAVRSGLGRVSTVPALAAGTSAHRAELGYRTARAAGRARHGGLVACRTRNAAAVALLGWNPLDRPALRRRRPQRRLDGRAPRARRRRCTGAPVAGAAWPLAAGFKVVPAILLPLELARTALPAAAPLVGGARRRASVDRRSHSDGASSALTG